MHWPQLRLGFHLQAGGRGPGCSSARGPSALKVWPWAFSSPNRLAAPPARSPPRPAVSPTVLPQAPHSPGSRTGWLASRRAVSTHPSLPDSRVYLAWSNPCVASAQLGASTLHTWPVTLGFWAQGSSSLPGRCPGWAWGTGTRGPVLTTSGSKVWTERGWGLLPHVSSFVKGGDPVCRQGPRRVHSRCDPECGRHFCGSEGTSRGSGT